MSSTADGSAGAATRLRRALVSADGVFRLLLGAIAAGAFVLAEGFDRGSALMPRAAAVLMLLLLAASFVRDALPPRSRGPATAGQTSDGGTAGLADAADETAEGTEGELPTAPRRRALLAGVTVGYGLLGVLFGLFVGSAVFCLVTLRLYGSSWLTTVLSAAGVLAVFYILFGVMLQTTLPGGLLVPLP